MALASLVVSLVAAIAAVLAWRVMDGQRRAADCPILALATQDEDIFWDSALRGSIYRQSAPVLSTVKNLGTVSAIWWGWRLEREQGTGERVSYGIGAPLGAGEQRTVAGLGNLREQSAHATLFSQGPAGTEWTTTITLKNGRVTETGARLDRGCKDRLLREISERERHASAPTSRLLADPPSPDPGGPRPGDD